MKQAKFDFSDWEEGQQAIWAAYNAADEGWKEAAWRALCDLARTGKVFCGTDVYRVTDQMGIFTPERRASGGLFLKARRYGIIRPVNDYRPFGSHRRKVEMWIGV